MKNWKLGLVAVVLIAVALLLAKNLMKPDDQPEPKTAAAKTVLTQPVSKVKTDPSLNLTGNVEAVRESVVSTKIAGRVSEVRVKNGDAVSAGQPLIILEDQDYRNALTVSRSNLSKAEKNLESARSNLERSQDLFENGALSAKNLEDAQMMLDLAQADVDSALVAVDNAEESVKNTTICAPTAGVVANCEVKVGQFLSPGITLLKVADISSVYIVVNINQADLAQIKTGQTCKVTADTYPDRSFSGTVELINPTANPSTRLFETKIRVANAGHRLRPGMFVKVEIKTGAPVEVMAVPQNAVVAKAGSYYVFIMDGDRVKRQQVEVGQVLDELVEIKSGLKDGQTVVVTGVNTLKDQDQVTIGTSGASGNAGSANAAAPQATPATSAINGRSGQ